MKRRKDKKTKRQKDEKSKRQKDEKTLAPSQTPPLKKCHSALLHSFVTYLFFVLI